MNDGHHSNGPTWREWQAHIQAGHMNETQVNARFDKLETRVNQLFGMLAGITVLANLASVFFAR